MSESVGFLVSDVARLMRRRFDDRARRNGASVAQWRTLKILERNQGINQGTLAELLEVEPITACRMIDRLEEAGLVERRRDPADRRAWKIFLTERAGPVLEGLHSLAGEMIEETLQGLSLPQREELMAMLQLVRSNLSQDTNDENEAAHG